MYLQDVFQRRFQYVFARFFEDILTKTNVYWEYPWCDFDGIVAHASIFFIVCHSLMKK